MITQMEPHRAADLIVLLINNDQPYYKQKRYMFENLEKKVERGTYDRTLALKLFKNLTDKVRMDWNKRYSADQGEIMPVKGSRLADIELRHDFEVEYLQYEKGMKGTVQTGKF